MTCRVRIAGRLTRLDHAALLPGPCPACGEPLDSVDARRLHHEKSLSHAGRPISPCEDRRISRDGA